MTTTPEAVADQLKQSVLDAIDSLRAAFGDRVNQIVPDGLGGAWVELQMMPLADIYMQKDTFVLFLLPFNLPGSDIYPMFVRPDLARTDGQVLGEAISLTEVSWPGEATPRPAHQLSRRTRGEFAAQTAAQKVDKVLEWLRSR